MKFVLAILLALSVQLNGADGRAKRTPVKHYPLGCIGDPKFPKGVMSFEVSPFRAVPVAQRVDLSAYMTPDDDQGAVGRCTGHGLARALAASYKKLTGRLPLFSPNFIYYNERVHLGTVDQDSGARIGTDGIWTLKTHGAAMLCCWDMAQDWREKPHQMAYKSGLKQIVLHAYNVDNRNGDDLLRALSAGFVVVYGMELKESFEHLNSDSYFYIPIGRVIGHHCMVMFGYDLQRGEVTSHNQWGDSFGLHDTFKMNLAHAHSRAVSDCYVIDAVRQ